MIRRVVACCRPHEFVGVPGNMMNGIEFIAALGDTEQEVDGHISDLLRMYGWHHVGDEQWQCGKHSASFVDTSMSKKGR